LGHLAIEVSFCWLDLSHSRLLYIARMGHQLITKNHQTLSLPLSRKLSAPSLFSAEILKRKTLLFLT